MNNWTKQDSPTRYSRTSKSRLNSCHDDIKRLFIELAKDGYDISIVCGTRNKKAQNIAFNFGFSGCKWPDSNHNSYPSLAVDAAPHIAGVGIPWKDENLWVIFAGVVLAKAQELNIDIEWGGFYKINDLNHFQLAAD